MGCSGCGTKTKIGLPAGCRNNGSCSTTGCGSMLDVYDWLSNIYYDDEIVKHPIIEVKFKGTRKEYYRNVYGVPIETGDMVVTESHTSGWDIGMVSLTGELVRVQMKKYRISEESDLVKNLLRRATEADLEKYEEGKNLEYETMLKARRLANSLGLTMKISDVEYQGDRTKATFFYTAEGRVDFRELIKVLAREFKIKVEMRQIGLRQEAGRLGGIGSCGRELCCSTWLTDFHSVPTTAARYQNLFLNPLKLSGQCGRLKCCLNYELDVYVEALSDFPEENTILKTTKGNARVEKLDILKKIMWFKYDNEPHGAFLALDVDKVKEIIELNERGETPGELEEFRVEVEDTEEVIDFKDVVGEERLDRFDRKNRRQNKNRNRSREGTVQQSQGQRKNQGQRQGQDSLTNQANQSPQNQRTQAPRQSNQQGVQNSERRGNRRNKNRNRPSGPRPTNQ